MVTLLPTWSRKWLMENQSLRIILFCLWQGLPFAAYWGVHESGWLAGCAERLPAKHAPHQAADVCLPCRWWHGLSRKWIVSASVEREGGRGSESGKEEGEGEGEREREQSVNSHFFLIEILFIVIWLLGTSLCTRMIKGMCRQRWQTLDSQGGLIFSYQVHSVLDCSTNYVIYLLL